MLKSRSERLRISREQRSKEQRTLEALKLKLKNADQIEEARRAARYFGAEAVANDEGLDEYREDIAIRYGYKSWNAMPSLVRSDAMKQYHIGRSIERQNKALP